MKKKNNPAYRKCGHQTASNQPNVYQGTADLQESQNNGNEGIATCEQCSTKQNTIRSNIAKFIFWR